MSITQDINKPYIGDIWEGWKMHGWSSPVVDRRTFTSYSETPVMWRNEIYTPLPVQCSNVSEERNRAPGRVTLSVDNTGNYLLPFILGNEDMVGFVIERWRTLTKYLDGQPTADPNMHFPVQKYIVISTDIVSNSVVRLTLSTKLDRPQSRLPRRVILRQPDIPYTVYAPAIGAIGARPR